VRADIHARGFWGRRPGALFDVGVFHFNAPSYHQTQVVFLFQCHELEKKREYGDRVRTVECEAFTPPVFSTFDGLGKEVTGFYNRLADPLSYKHNTPYNQTLSWMRYALSFLFLHSAVLAIRGSKTLKPTELPAVSTELRLVESRISID